MDHKALEEFLTLSNEKRISEKKKLVIWGTGERANYLIEKTGIVPAYFIDSNEAKKKFQDCSVLHPGGIESWKDFFVIVAVEKNEEILSFLAKKDLERNVDYETYREYIDRPSVMLERTMSDTAYYDFDCRTMFNHLEILRDGETACCCTTFMDERLGNVLTSTKEEIWNSIRHKILCLSVLNRTYTFCKKDMCPLFVGKERKERKADQPIRGIEEVVLGDAPETLVLAHDRTCNLYCETCRQDRFMPDRAYTEKTEKITEVIKKEYLENADFLVLAGDGEVFASKAYRDVFSSEKCNSVRYIRLLSNGMLFNEKNWKQLNAGKNAAIMLTTSVDAATKETYEKIRRGGDFDILKKNMEYAASLKRSGELRYFRMNFVVQKENYQEMPAFVKWGEELGCDEVFFTKILNWGTYSEEEFKNISMMEEDGVTPKAELFEIMQDPAMKSKIVDMGTIQALHVADEAENVKIYYMWELEKRGGRLFE